MTRLTKRRLEAIEEALNARLAGELNAEFDEDHLKQKDYEAARAWVTEQLHTKRSKPTATPDRRCDAEIAKNCANWKSGYCEVCGAQWQSHEVSAFYVCPHFKRRED